jgi:hypothetical protein
MSDRQTIAFTVSQKHYAAIIKKAGSKDKITDYLRDLTAKDASYNLSAEPAVVRGKPSPFAGLSAAQAAQAKADAKAADKAAHAKNVAEAAARFRIVGK